VNAEVSPGQAGWTIVPVEPPMLLEDCQSRVMQNGLYVAVSAQAPLPPRLQAIGDNVANMNVVGRVVTGASFETEMTRAGEARLRRSDPRQSGQIGAAHLRGDEPIDRGALMRRSLHRPHRRLPQRRQARRIVRDRRWRPVPK
jgi:hypothetical protein